MRAAPRMGRVRRVWQLTARAWLKAKSFTRQLPGREHAHLRAELIPVPEPLASTTISSG